MVIMPGSGPRLHAGALPAQLRRLRAPLPAQRASERTCRPINLHAVPRLAAAAPLTLHSIALRSMPPCRPAACTAGRVDECDCAGSQQLCWMRGLSKPGSPVGMLRR